MSVRLQINVSDDVCNQIDTFAKEIGITRNAMCAVLLHDGVKNRRNMKNGDKNDFTDIGDEIEVKSVGN